MTCKTELALLRERQLAALRTATGQPERITLGFACASQDRGFRVAFARQLGAKRFTCEGVEKDPHIASPLQRLQGLFRPKALTLTPEELDFSGLVCAWCGDATQWVSCGRCKAFICGARSRGSSFVCRPSCGCQGQTQALGDVDAARQSGSSPRPAIGRAAAPYLPRRPR
ncbi:hypothetical protein [Methylocella sp.]|uniref:hypothetical protein n=1 Tax=Methylocella sp. TaxID=1978226 RepID=UPI0037832ABF